MTTAATPHAAADDGLLWVLNQYRAAEIRGAGVILRLGRMADNGGMRSNFTRHLRDEGVHAWLWTRAILELDGEILDVEDAYQVRLGAHFGIPRTLTDLLALTLISERRGVAAYEEHLDVPNTPDAVTRALRGILKDERWHVSWISEELERRGESDPSVADAIRRAEEADRKALEDLRDEADGLPAGIAIRGGLVTAGI